jgi:hypothetical protein
MDDALFAARAKAVLNDMRIVEADYYAVTDQLQAARQEVARLERAQQLAHKRYQELLAERRTLLAEDQRGRLYRERGA